ncbi:MAG: ABC transporter permease subunit [Eubacteriales bacterium]|nr:ABC transporter permease subunit [Eubacteriales bacterium]
MKAIYGKEFRSYFNTMTGYVFLTVFLIGGGLLFSFTNIIGESAKLQSVLFNLQYVLFFITPVLTMHLFAGERRTKTDRMLFAAPIHIRSIVAGKFFSALTVLLIAFCISFIYPAILAIFGTPAVGEIALGYLGLLLFGGALISIGMFISSFTTNQANALFATFGVIICILFAQTMIPGIDNAFLRTALIKTTLSYHFYYFESGILSLKSVVYFISVMILFLFLAARIMARRRWS